MKDEIDSLKSPDLAEISAFNPVLDCLIEWEESNREYDFSFFTSHVAMDWERFELSKKQYHATVNAQQKENAKYGWAQPCAHCGTGFTSYDKKQIYCSPECKAEYQKLPDLLCEHCGTKFPYRTGAKFCSWKCGHAHTYPGYVINGERKSLREWCAQYGVKYTTAYARIKKGIPIETALCLEKAA